MTLPGSCSSYFWVLKRNLGSVYLGNGKEIIIFICYCSHSALPSERNHASISLAKVSALLQNWQFINKNFPEIRFLYIYNLTVTYDLTITHYLGKLYPTFSLTPSIMSWQRPKTSRSQQIPKSLPHPWLLGIYIPSFPFKTHWFFLTSLLRYIISPCFNAYHCHAYHWCHQSLLNMCPFPVISMSSNKAAGSTFLNIGLHHPVATSSSSYLSPPPSLK